MVLTQLPMFRNRLLMAFVACLLALVATPSSLAGVSDSMQSILGWLNQARAKAGEDATEQNEQRLREVRTLLESIADEMAAIDAHGRTHAIDFSSYAESIREETARLRRGQASDTKVSNPSGIELEVLTNIIRLCSTCHSQLESGDLVVEAFRQ